MVYAVHDYGSSYSDSHPSCNESNDDQEEQKAISGTDKHFKQILNEHCQKQHMEQPRYVVEEVRWDRIRMFNCTVEVSGQVFASADECTMKKLSEHAAAKEACYGMGLLQRPLHEPVNEQTAEQTAAKKARFDTIAVQVDERPKIYINSLEEVFQHSTNEQMADAFKSLLIHRATLLQVDTPEFTVVDTEENTVIGFRCTVVFSGVSYQCNGIQANQRIAENSASEVALKSLGLLPAVDYVIKPFEGHPDYDGFTMAKVPKEMKEPGAKQYGSLLFQALSGHGFCPPKFNTRQATVTGTDGVMRMSYIGECMFEGKLFESAPITSMKDARQNAAKVALAYLGIHDADGTIKVKDAAKVKTGKPSVFLKACKTPSKLSASVTPRRIHHHCVDTMLFEEGIISRQNKYIPVPGKNTALQPDGEPKVSDENALKAWVEQEPSFDGVLVKEMTDVTVTETDPSRTDLVVIGNRSFSIGMIMTTGRIFCVQQNKFIELKPGDQLLGLESTMKFSTGSLKMFLKAVKCQQVITPSTPLPALTNCGLVILMHDNGASPTVQVLLKRQFRTGQFIGMLQALQLFARRLLSGRQPCKLDFENVTKDMHCWLLDELECLSVMTKESIKEMYDSLWGMRAAAWSNVFEGELCDDLKQLQGICTTELQRRKSLSGRGSGDDDKRPWTLPHGPFHHRLISTGLIHETVSWCFHRTFRTQLGMKVNLGDTDACPYVDLPVLPEENEKPHKGDFTRYLIYARWKEADTDTDEKEEEKAPVTSRWRKTEIAAAEAVKKWKEMEAEGDGLIQIKPPTLRRRVYEECKWFAIDEAAQICPSFARIVQTKLFEDEFNKVV